MDERQGCKLKANVGPLAQTTYVYETEMSRHNQRAGKPVDF